MDTLSREKIFWKKKEYISFLLSIFVFLIHSYFIITPSDGSLISLFNEKTAFFFCRSITQFAVPMFFMLSGVTFFKEYSNKKYFGKLKSRLFTLLIPYLLWNTIWMLYEIFCSYSFISNYINNANPFEISFLNILKGIFFYECYGPFWYLFDLIIFSLAAPLLFLIIRNKYVGIASIIILSILSLFGIHLPTDLFYSPTAVIFYLIGALVGYHYFDFILKKPKKWMQISSIVFLAAYIGAKNLVPSDLHYDNTLTETITFTLCAFALWNIVDIFIERLKPRAIYSRSFAIYATHLGVSSVIWKVYSSFLPQWDWLLVPQFFLRVTLTILVINLICAFLERFLPNVYAILMGNRTKRTIR